MKIEFRTRPSWLDAIDGYQFGDLIVDGEDRGWSSLEDARALAEENGTTVEFIDEEDAVESHPRRI